MGDQPWTYGRCQGNGNYLPGVRPRPEGRSDFPELFVFSWPARTEKNTLYLFALTVPALLFVAS